MSSLVTFLDTYNFSSIKHPDISEAPKVEHKCTWKNTSPGEKKIYTSVKGITAEVFVLIFTTTQISFLHTDDQLLLVSQGEREKRTAL